jgi:hypothetical protein
MTKAKIQPYIQQETKRMIPEEHQKAFVEDVKEDLVQIDESRIVGLGITSQQLNEWLKLYRN